MVKAVSLLSGGLDSILATKLVLEQGIEIEGIYFANVFSKEKNNLKFLKDKLGIKINTFQLDEEIINIVKKPKHGYGKNLNPCIDCRILMLKKAKQYMKEAGASFLITGEVLEERPMSQRSFALKLIEREAGLEGFILRPLSARLLPPTIAEKQGLINRDKLLSISGRSRKIQIELAEQFGIKNYPWPAGGCLLTDPGFCRRLSDLIRHNPNFGIRDVEFLKLGRHFRLSIHAKLIVARDDIENQKIISLAEPQDLLFYSKIKQGPVALGRGEFNSEMIKISAGILSRYYKSSDSQPVEIICRMLKETQENTISYSITKEEVEKYLL